MKFTIRFLSTLFLSLLAAVPVRSQTVVSLPSNDIAYDAVTQMIYASVPSTGPVGRANTVTPINPATGVLGASIAVGVNPNRLAISEDGQFLYAGLLGTSSISLITLATQTVGLQITIPPTVYGNLPAGEIKVLPGNPRTIAIVRACWLRCGADLAGRLAP
jgi:trimeric autotransporter adhesin